MGIILTSYSIWLGSVFILFLLLIIYITNGKYRFLTAIIFSFLVSFSFFQITNIFIDSISIPVEIRVLLKRSLLIIIVSGLFLTYIFNKKEFSFFNHNPKWDNPVFFPFLWKGFHSIKASHFLLIALLINVAIFTPFILQQQISDIKSILLFCILFSIINGFLEELIWRGVLLSCFKEYTSDFYAIFMTSLGFGFQHISIGIPFYISLFFSIGGFFYAAIVFRTNSIYPAVIWHIFMNIGMVLSGMIL